MFINKRLIFALFLFCFSTNIKASIWIEADEIQIKHAVSFLSTAGHIKTPITTYPLPYSSIIKELESLNNQDLTKQEIKAKDTVLNDYMEKTKQNLNLKASIKLATNDKRFNYSGGQIRESNETNLKATYKTDNFYVSLNPTYSAKNSYGNNTYFDNSYINYDLGNWYLTAGSFTRFWGPGNASGLIMTNNARPAPGVFITRDEKKAIDLPFLNYLGPWNLHMGFEHLGDERYIYDPDQDQSYQSDYKLFSMRVEFRPIPALEVGFSRIATMCGTYKPCDFDAFYKMFIGETNVGRNGVTENEANQSGGFDMKLNFDFLNNPSAIYFEEIGEDSSQDFPYFQAKSSLMGAQTYLNLNETIYNFYVEYTNTFVTCQGGNPNCAYEHSVYETGLRFKERTFGSTFDNDAASYIFGVNFQRENLSFVDLNIAYVKLNKDGTDAVSRANEDLVSIYQNGGNTVSPNQEEILYALNANYSFFALKGKILLGSSLSYSDYKTGVLNGQSNTDLYGYLGYEYQF